MARDPNSGQTKVPDEVFTYTGSLFPDAADKRFWRNVTLAVGVPGALTFAISKAVNNRLAAKEAEAFEKQVREFVQAENPVLSLDPNLDDAESEEAAALLGLQEPEDRPTRESLWAKTRSLLGRKAMPNLGGWKNNVPSSFRITGDLEPGILIALGWLSTIAAWNIGRRSGAKTRLKTTEAQTAALENRLEQSEYNRLFQANDPEGFEKTVLKKMSAADRIDAIVQAPDRSEAAVLRLAVLRHTAKTGDEEQVVAQPGVLTRGYRGLQDVMSGIATAGEWTYPSVFAALLLGGYYAGHHYGVKTDRFRKRQKQLKKILTRELLDNQTPAVLAVGSDLPWEKAKHLPAAQAADPSASLPEDVENRRLRERREVRI